ncbi:esterase 1 [Fomitiporia mediterranea MF3/22]|uniref:esterase 1 n=1 Tax=Fomitiporia mediterranea (strain MF3/22) TaxID=694068 RepID=UPI0004409531|nr:esterase 1 [Fomitiporia mediterranea MF3/22]EJD02496.1 esterase 1 [Fomitiporia mediterranea MF3/22]
MHPSVLLPLVLILSGCSYALPEVQIYNTTISGRSVPELQEEFFGNIPFAEPPVGELRFAPPVNKLDPGVASLNATQYGAACAQLAGFGSNSSLVEDCLTLNILRPANVNSSTNPVPVLLWVYGGAFQNGQAYTYDGSLLVAQSVERGTPIVYVSVNYRVGPFGYPQGHEAEAQGALNLGHKDVVSALTWVQQNIAAFGGDENQITVAGVSAGAVILSHLTLDPQFNLARAAIFESGSPATVSVTNATAREQAWQTLVANVPECAGATPNNTFSCLRSASTETIVNATAQVNPFSVAFRPVIDGPGGVLPDLPSKLYAGGRVPIVPFITGDTLDEGTFFVPTNLNTTEEARQFVVGSIISATASAEDQTRIADKILEFYPDDPTLGSPYGTGNETFGLGLQYKRLSAVAGDVEFQSLRRQLAQVASEKGVKVHAYLFTDKQLQPELAYLGVYHGAEVAYVFGAPPNGPPAEALSDNIIDYWVSFVTSLDPNDGLGNSSRPTWAQYTTSSEQNVIQFDSTNLTMIPDTYRQEQIAFLIDQGALLDH